MWKNYIQTVTRSLLKNKALTFINISGLGLGLAASLLIIQYVNFEYSYDKFHSKSDRIYRIINDRFQDGESVQKSTYSYPAVSPTLAREYPEIESYSRLLVPGGETSIKAGNEYFLGDKSFFVDQNFSQIFDFPLLAGDKASALENKKSTVITQSAARKYFPNLSLDEIIGKELYWGVESEPYVVKGISENVRANSHIQFDILLSYASLYSPDYRQFDESWTMSNVRHYVLLKPDAEYHKLETKFDTFCERHFQGDKVTGSVEKLSLQPLSDVHLYSDYEYEYAKTDNGKVVNMMMFIAIIILITALVNYINLTTLRFPERALEVGIRKVMGASKTQLKKQFLLESVVVSFLALALAIVITKLSYSYFNSITGASISFFETTRLSDWILTSGILLSIILSGFYPALILSAHHPVKALKGKMTGSNSTLFLRKCLVIFQFTMLSALLITSLIVSKQIRYMSNLDLKVNIDNMMIISPPMRTAWDSTYFDKVRSFKREVSQLHRVQYAATSSFVPGTLPHRAFDIELIGQATNDKYTMNRMVVDEEFFGAYDIKLLEGRAFNAADYDNIDWNKVDKIIINENVGKLLNRKPGSLVGEKLKIEDKIWNIIGVVEDFHQQSLHNAIEPIFFIPDYGTFNPISVKFNDTNYKEAIVDIKASFDRSFPDNAFNYHFLEDQFNHQYNDDHQLKKIINAFTLLSIIISMLGLIGLASYAAIQRIKEIGIRKVLGASITNVISILTINFIKLVFFATLISIPLAYLTVDYWLSNYAYKISQGVFFYLLPMISIIIIASITIGLQVFKTAKTNPVEVLKHK